jgi:peroxiredoxin Q/BCP
MDLREPLWHLPDRITPLEPCAGTEYNPATSYGAIKAKPMRSLILNCLAASAIFGMLPSNSRAESKIPTVGDQAPLIQGKDQNGQTWKLQDALVKQAVLLYFYPKDDTPGCTKEACGLRDRMGDLKKQEVQVIGVSFDPADSHQKFISKFNLNFPLLADTDGTIADAYGVRMKGRSMARRVSFLIDKKGVIRHVTDNPSADVHLNEMKDAIAMMGHPGH